MGLEKINSNTILGWTKANNKSLLATIPIRFNPKEIRWSPELAYDTFCTTKYSKEYAKIKNCIETSGMAAHCAKRIMSSGNGLKKTQFTGFDLAVVEKFKAPIEKFKSVDELQGWAKQKITELFNRDFKGRKEDIEDLRMSILENWTNHLIKENNGYDNSTSLLILDSLIKPLKANNDMLPPTLHRKVLADCISEINKNIKADRKYQFNFKKMYETKLRTLYVGDIKNVENTTGWIIIPSKKHDPQNYEANIEKLKILSHSSWCTSGSEAPSYLRSDDFHIYYEKGQPQIGMSFDGTGKVYEVQGIYHLVPLPYFNEIKNHIQEINPDFHINMCDRLARAEETLKEVEKVKKDLKDAIKNNDAKEIFKYFGFLKKENSKGFLILEKYKQPSDFYTFKDLGIDENKLLEKVKRIESYANFEGSQVTAPNRFESITNPNLFKKFLSFIEDVFD